MTVKTLERRLARLQAKKRSFDSWTDKDLDRAIELYARASDQLTPEEENELQLYAPRLPPIPEEIAAKSPAMLDQQIRKLQEQLGLRD